MDLLDNSMNDFNKNDQNKKSDDCNHSIIDDYIDLDYGEKSQRIFYCEKCLLDETTIKKLNRTNLSISTSSVCTTCR